LSPAPHDRCLTGRHARYLEKHGVPTRRKTWPNIVAELAVGIFGDERVSRVGRRSARAADERDHREHTEMLRQFAVGHGSRSADLSDRQRHVRTCRADESAAGSIMVAYLEPAAVDRQKRCCQ